MRQFVAVAALLLLYTLRGSSAAGKPNSHYDLNNPQYLLDEPLCVNASLEAAGKQCGLHLLDLDVAKMSPARFAELCNDCLPSISLQRSSKCPQYNAFASSFEADCRVCNNLRSAERCTQNKDLCVWDHDARRCIFGSIPNRERTKRRAEAQGGNLLPILPVLHPIVLPPSFTLQTLTNYYTIGRFFSLPPITTAPPATSTACESILLQAAANLCGQVLTSTDLAGSGDECRIKCSFCLSAMFTINVGLCSTFTSVQAAFSAQCQLCMIATTAPAPTLPQTTSSEITPAPVATTAPTTACETNLLIAAGNACNQSSLPYCDMTNLEHTQCQVLCSFCLSTVVTLSATSCGAYAAIQASFIAQCHNCLTPPPVTNAPTTVAPLPPTPPPTSACAYGLLQAASSTCGYDLVGLDLGNNATECAIVCSVCLNVVLSAVVSDCSAYISIQASFAAQCQICAPEVTTTVIAPTTTEAQATSAPTVAVTPAPTNPTCEYVKLELAAQICGYSLIDLNIQNNNTECEIICNFCLSACLSISAGECGAFATIQASLVAQCAICAPAAPTPTPTPPPTTEVQPTPAPPTPVPTGCEVALIQASIQLCGLSVVAFDLHNMYQCQFVCSACLTAVLTVEAGSCSAFASIQASLVADCHTCMTTTAAPPPSTTPYPSTTEAQQTTAPTASVTPIPTSPPPTCDEQLLVIAATSCGYFSQNLTALNAGTLEIDACNELCCECFSTVMVLGSCHCAAFAAIQIAMTNQCLYCKMNEVRGNRTIRFLD